VNVPRGRFVTREFSTEDVLLAAQWAKAKRLFEKQRARIAPEFAIAPPGWEEIGLENRLDWWELAGMTADESPVYLETPGR